MIQSMFVPNITATDLTGSKRVRYKAPMDSTMGDLIEELLPRLRLPSQDSAGRALTYHARVNRLGRHAHSSELVGDTLVQGDGISLHPNVEAGGAR